MHAVISLLLLVTKQEILVIYLTYCLLHTVQTTSTYVILLPAIRGVYGNDFVFQQDSAPAHCARATVEVLCQETPDFLASNHWPPNSPDLNPVDYEIWAVMQRRAYTRDKSIVWMDCNGGSSTSGAVMNS